MVTYNASSLETSTAFDHSLSLPHIRDFRNFTKLNEESEAEKKLIFQLQRALDLICPSKQEIVKQPESKIIQPQKKILSRSKSVEPPSRASVLFKTSQVTVAAGTSKECLCNIVKYDESRMPSSRSQQSDFLLPLDSFNNKPKDVSPDWKKKMIIDSKFGPARNRQAIAFRNGLDSTQELWKSGQKNSKMSRLRSLSNPKSNLFPWDGIKDEIIYQPRDFNEEDEAENTERLIKMIEGPSGTKPISRSSSVPVINKRLPTSSSKGDTISTFTQAFADPQKEKNPEPTASTFRDPNFSLEMFARTQRRFMKLGIEHRIPKMPPKERDRLTSFVESEYINRLIEDDVQLATELEQLMRRSFMRKLYKQNEVQRHWFSGRVLEADIDHLSYRIKEEAIQFKLLRNQKHGPKRPEKALDAWDSKRETRTWLRPSRQAKLRQMNDPLPEDIPKLEKFSISSPKDPYLEIIDKPIMDPNKRYLIVEKEDPASNRISQPQTRLKSREQSRLLQSEQRNRRPEEQQSHSVPGESRRQMSKGKENQQRSKLSQAQVNNQKNDQTETGPERRKRIAKKLLKLLQYLKKLKIISKEFSKLKQILNKKPFEKEETKGLLKALKEDDLFEVSFIVDKNCYVVYDFDQMHQTALHWAVKRNYVKMAQFLIEKRSDIDAEDITGNTPLYYALKANNLELIKILLIAKANPWRTRRVRYKDLVQDWMTDYYLYHARRISLNLRFIPANQRDNAWEKEAKIFYEKPERLKKRG